MRNKNYDFITHDEFKRFVGTIPKIPAYTKYSNKAPISKEELQLLFKLAYYCALKTNEVIGLTKSDFDLNQKEITVEKTRKTVPNTTTIPPNLIPQLQEFLEKFEPEEKLFKINRALIWKYGKQTGELSDLNVFKSKIKDSKSLMVLFRDSRWRQMVEDGSGTDLADRKLRAFSIKDYAGKTIEDLKEWESSNQHLLTYGAVIFLDVLGTKGIWKEKTPNQFLKNWNLILENANRFANSKEFVKTNFTIRAFSDTIIITGKEQDIETIILDTGLFVKALVTIGMQFNLFFRGTISVGNFIESENMVIGQAVDEGAQYYEQADWIGVYATPSAYSVMQRIESNSKLNKKLKNYFIKYDIPLKNGVDREGWALKLDPDKKFIDIPQNPSTNSGKILIDFVHEQLENLVLVEAGPKWKNTLSFLEFIKNHKQ